jgi:hypothetical protein
MTLTMRKVAVAGSIIVVLLLANAVAIAEWLARLGLVGLAQGLRQECITGTAITIIVVMLLLFVRPAGIGPMSARRCPVCDHQLDRAGRYCPECGSRVTGVPTAPPDADTIRKFSVGRHPSAACPAVGSESLVCEKPVWGQKERPPDRFFWGAWLSSRSLRSQRLQVRVLPGTWLRD